jgi:BirA family biotin operon repressor/biotin-[acetyl-CoA-carboxylase] ligase
MLEDLRRLLPAEISPLHRPCVDSTNTWLLERACAGALERPALLVADEQRAGRGRLGRRWHARAGRSLILSFAPAAAHTGFPAPAYSMVAALAVRAAVRAACELVPELEWPNDLLVGGRKLAGILVEARSRGSAIEGLVIGVGMNVREERAELHPEIRAQATSLAIEGAPQPDLAALAAGIAGELHRRLGAAARAGPEGIARDYAAALGLIGRAVCATADGGEHRGVVRRFELGHGLELEGRAARRRLPLERIASLRPLARESGPGPGLGLA